MKKILFVCYGNICRSPMAQFVLADMAKKRGVSDRLEIASKAATDEEQGNPVYPPAARELARHGIACDGHRAVKITAADCAYYDEIYYMDGDNLRRLKRMFPDCGKFRPLLPRDVADPWYTGDFASTWDDICEGCEKILEEMS